MSVSAPSRLRAGVACDRRGFLRAAGALVALPWLESRAHSMPAAASKRMLCIMSDMGVLPANFYPQQPGRDYELTPYLDILKDHRSQMTVCTGLGHRATGDGHKMAKTFLSGAPQPNSSSFKNTISVDQLAAEQVGFQTRFPSLVLAVGPKDGHHPSTLRSGVTVPAETSPAAVYRKLFLQGDAAAIQRRLAELRDGRSILDFVRDEARTLERDVTGRDRERIEQFFSSVRDVEKTLVEAATWERRPKPKVPGTAPQDVADQSEMEQATNVMFDIARLALETDSTRVVTVALRNIHIRPTMPGVTQQIHGLTHHGGDADKIAQLRRVEEMLFGTLNRLLTSMQAAPGPSGSLLASTMVLYGSNLSDANKHDTQNLPIILAGGGFRHGQHLASKPGTPLCNLYVSMLQQMGFEIDTFSFSTGTLTGLEAV